MKKMMILAMQITLAFCIAAIGCLPPSNNVVSARITGSEYTATLSKRNSGAMSKGSTLVSVRANGVPDDSTHGLIVLGVNGDHPIEIIWSGPRSLSISCQQCTPQDVNFEAVKSGDVTISYDNGLNVR